MLWIDYDTDGTAKYEYFMGSEAKKYWNNDSQNFFAQWLQRLRPVPSMVINPVSLLMNGVADLIGKLSIPQKYWDCARTDYVALPFVTQGSDCPDNCITPEGWAFTAGIWDGIVNEVKGVPEGLGAIASDPVGVATALGNLVTFDGPTWTAIKDKIITEHSEAASNTCLLNHLIATDIIATAAAVLPLTKLSKANIATTLTNLADNTLLTITKFKIAGQVAYKTAGGAMNIVRNAGKLTFEVLSQGGRISRAYVNGAGKLYTTILIVNPDGIVAAIKEVKEILKNADGTPLLDANRFQLARAELRNGNEVLVALDEFDDAITSKWATYLANNEWDVFRRKSTDVLRKSLAIPDGSGLHAHHKIPVEMLKTDDYIQAAVNQGFEFSGTVNGKALTGYEHLFTNATFYPNHNAYNRFVKSVVDQKRGLVSVAKTIVENEVMPEINKFLQEAETAGVTINDYAISKGFPNTKL